MNDFEEIPERNNSVELAVIASARHSGNRDTQEWTDVGFLLLLLLFLRVSATGHIHYRPSKQPFHHSVTDIQLPSKTESRATDKAVTFHTLIRVRDQRGFNEFLAAKCKTVPLMKFNMLTDLLASQEATKSIHGGVMRDQRAPTIKRATIT